MDIASYQNISQKQTDKTIYYLIIVLMKGAYFVKGMCA